MIKVQSLIQDKNGLQPVEVELALWPGLPGIQFLGLADQHLKESGMRIKSAIKAAGFQFPVAQQILVNLRPSHLKKTSRGLELAVAAAYLWETKQARTPVGDSDFFIYGELGLSGDVIEPEDLHTLPSEKVVVLTGNSDVSLPVSFRRQGISHLKELETPREIPAQPPRHLIERPWDLVRRKFSPHQARLLEILATGEHSAILAGPAGSGKSTIVQSLAGFLRKPTQAEFHSLLRIHREFGIPLQWRPIVKPHHSTPTKAMIGGGSIPFAGEISRAHGGVLILDELLEFTPTVQEALREPFEEGKMRIYRNGHLKEYPAQSQILATTNLCPCGKWTPVHPEAKHCAFSLQKCRSHGPRLSGPLVDRFETLEFTEGIGEFRISGEEILQKIERAQSFSNSLWKSVVPNSRRSFEELKKQFSKNSVLTSDLEESSSQRRKSAVLKVARTLADLELSEKIERHHWDEAKRRTVISFQRLSRWS